MVRILYGVCGVGMGHAVRSKVILEYLEKKHELVIVSSHESYYFLKKHFKKVYSIEGFELVLSRNAILNFKTFLKNFRKASWENYLGFKKTEEKINQFHPELVISDWETYTSLYAKKYYVPLISLDNAHYLLFGKYHYPRSYYLQYLKAKKVLESLMVKAKHYLVLCFDHQELRPLPEVSKGLSVLREGVLKAKPSIEDFVLVYLTSRQYKEIGIILQSVDERFILYGNENKSEKNLEFRRFGETKGFIQDLVRCKAVISSGGFTLLSEAIHLGKPLFVLPLKNHFEQLLNALYIEKYGYGVYKVNPQREDFVSFFKKLESYSQERNPRKDNKLFFTELERVMGKVLEDVS